MSIFKNPNFDLDLIVYIDLDLDLYCRLLSFGLRDPGEFDCGELGSQSFYRSRTESERQNRSSTCALSPVWNKEDSNANSLWEIFRKKSGMFVGRGQ